MRKEVSINNQINLIWDIIIPDEIILPKVITSQVNIELSSWISKTVKKNVGMMGPQFSVFFPPYLFLQYIFLRVYLAACETFSRASREETGA